MNFDKRLKKVSEILKDHHFTFAGGSRYIPCASFVGGENSYIDSYALKEIAKYVKSFSICIEEKSLFIWMRFKEE